MQFFVIRIGYIKCLIKSNAWVLLNAPSSQYLVLQVGMMLRGMGFDKTTSVYVAAGKIYKAEKYMAPLRQMFPRLETKDTLATPEELAAFKVLYWWSMIFKLICQFKE